MKSFLFLISVVLISFLSSCQDQTVTTEKTVTTVIKLDNPGTDGFVLKVKRGDTVWDFSQKIYGTGFEWRKIIAQNPFLNEPNRIEKKDGKWIVWIYPGEEIRIGDKVVTANGQGEITETTVTTTTTNPPQPSWPWYWFAVAIIALCLITTFLIILILHFVNRNRDRRNEECGIVRIPRGSNPDTVLEMNRDRRKYETVTVFANAVANASGLNLLSNFNYKDNPTNGIDLNVIYRNTPTPDGQQ